uniref:dUTPase n=1 Tax=Pseudomonas phage HRDY3 TaxID=3236930 RepID=A0AB39CEK1_9VIRU
MPGIMSDRWIDSMCQPQRKALFINGEFYAWANTHKARKARELPPCGARLLKEKIIDQTPMISPYSGKQVSQVKYKALGDDDGERSVHKIIPYGLSSYGYDIRVGNEFKIFTNLNTTVVDPKNFTEDNFVTKKVRDGQAVIIPPNSFALANTPEQFKIDRDTLVVCLGKSTYARCGIIVNVTPLEPEWEGSLTLEFSNTTPLPAMIYAGEGCAQILFLSGDDDCEVSYADRKGKYMNQSAVPTAPKML